MVDFNNDATIGTPAVDVVRILILQRRSDLFEALEQYNKQEIRGIQCDLAVVRSRLISLFYELQSGLKRRSTVEEYNSIVEGLKSDKIDDVKKIISKVNHYLDEIRLIRLDNKPHVDKKNWEAVNSANDY